MGFTRRALEARAIPTSGLASPAGWMVDLLGGRSSLAGVTVTPDTAIGTPAVLNAVSIVAKTIAGLPLELLRKRPGGGAEQAREHPLFPLLHLQPNRLMTSFEFRELLAYHLELWGNFYAAIETNRQGRIVALWPMLPNQVAVFLSPDRRQLWYQWTPPDRPQQWFAAEEVFHVRGMNSNGYVGHSPIAVARESLGLTMAAEEMAAAFFGNDATPGGVLEHPKTLGDKAYLRLKSEWQSRHGGPAAKGRFAIFEEGMQWKSIGMPLKDAQFVETRKFQIEEIARIFDLPLHKLKSLDKATFSNIEHQDIEFLIDSMGPRFVRIEQRLNVDLLSQADRERGLYFKFRLQGRLRGDMKSRHEAYAVGRQWGWLCADDVLELEDMNPLPDGKGKEYLVPLNMVPAGEPRPEAPPRSPRGPAAPDTDEDDARHAPDADAVARIMAHAVPVLADALGRCARKESLATRRQFERAPDLGVLAGWHETFWREHVDHVTEALLPLYRMVAASAGVPLPDVTARALAAAAAERERGAACGALAQALLAGADGVRALLDQWDSGRPVESARRERRALFNTFTPRGT